MKAKITFTINLPVEEVKSWADDTRKLSKKEMKENILDTIYRHRDLWTFLENAQVKFNKPKRKGK